MQNNNNNNNNNKNNPKPVKQRHYEFISFILFIVLIIGIIVSVFQMNTVKPEVKTYNEVYTWMSTKDVSFELNDLTAIPIGGENGSNLTLTGSYKDQSNHFGFAVNITSDQYETLTELARDKDITINLGTKAAGINITAIILAVATVILVVLVIYSLLKGSNNKTFDFGKSRAKLSRRKTSVFADVAGCDEEKEELVEIIDFLKNPKKYAEIGARIPKGVLLVGPPGTGKTLLARAVAGEANVPFFSISGSDFVEMFVGVGASRVRDLFKNAKENAPCIIFIDEIDAVGRQRGAGMGGGHDEREQTLNQLLVEMDGFNANLGIIMIAATNRPDVLDPALLRPGRFDRQIMIALPDVKGREAILKVHARNKNIAKNASLGDLAARIPGFSGADIENLLNEAALLAARENRRVIEMPDLDEAIDRVMMGPAKKSKKMSTDDINRVAHHEAGHAVIGLKLKNSDIVQKVTIVPRGRAGGYVLMTPEEEKYLPTRTTLLEQITGYLAGRVAEEIIFDDVSTGASDDFKKATAIARSMVTEYGMSDLGPVQYETPQGSIFLGRDYLKDKNFSDQVALEIDRETRRIIDECYEKALNCLNDNKELLLTIARYLKAVETLTKADIDEINKTGKLSWYDEREAKRIEKEKADAKAAQEAAEKAAIEAARVENLKNSTNQTDETEENKTDTPEDAKENKENEN